VGAALPREPAGSGYRTEVGLDRSDIDFVSFPSILRLSLIQADVSGLLLSFPMRNSRWTATVEAAWVGVALRTLAAAVGGYAFTSASTAALTVLMPLPKPDAVLVPTMFSFAFYVGAIVWAFAARSAWRAWLGLLAVTVPCAAVAFLLATRP
jgi:hypothetical protein